MVDSEQTGSDTKRENSARENTDREIPGRKAVTLNKIVAPKRLRIVAAIPEQSHPGAGGAAAAVAKAAELPDAPNGAPAEASLETSLDASPKISVPETAMPKTSVPETSVPAPYMDASPEAAIQHARAAVNSLKPLPIDAALAATASPGLSPLAKMSIAGVGLLAAIGGLLLWGAQSPNSPLASGPAELPLTARLLQAPSSGTEPETGTGVGAGVAAEGAGTALAPPLSRPEPTEPAETTELAEPKPPQTDLPPPPPPRLSSDAPVPPLRVEAVKPAVAVRAVTGSLQPVARPTAPRLGDRVAPLPLGGTSFMDEVTLGTVAALRGGSATRLPSAAETALLGFARVLAAEGRTAPEITRVLDEARAEGTLEIPARFLRPDGDIDIAAILAGIGQRN